LLLELLDKEKPEVIINFAAQGEGAVSWKHSWRFFETNSMALARLAEELAKRDWLERFIQIGTSEMYGSVDHATTEDESIKPSSPYAASKVAFDMYLMSVHKFLKFPDEHYQAIELLLPRPTIAPHNSESDLVWADQKQVACCMVAAAPRNPTCTRAISGGLFTWSPRRLRLAQSTTSGRISLRLFVKSSNDVPLRLVCHSMNCAK